MSPNSLVRPSSESVTIRHLPAIRPFDAVTNPNYPSSTPFTSLGAGLALSGYECATNPIVEMHAPLGRSDLEHAPHLVHDVGRLEPSQERTTCNLLVRSVRPTVPERAGVAPHIKTPNLGRAQSPPCLNGVIDGVAHLDFDGQVWWWIHVKIVVSQPAAILTALAPKWNVSSPSRPASFSRRRQVASPDASHSSPKAPATPTTK